MEKAKYGDLDKCVGIIAALSVGCIHSEDFRERLETVMRTLGLMTSTGLGGKTDAMAKTADGVLSAIEERIFL